MRKAFLGTILLLTACGSDETVRGHGAGGKTWALSTVNGVAFNAEATLEFPKEGVISGRAPCNAYSAEQLSPYPWFETGPIASTLTICPDFGKERQFFDVLERVTIVEVSGDVLLLSNDDGETMQFSAQPDG